jgi:hypothetical protein
MSKDDFIQNLRLATGSVAPRVHTDSPLLPADQVALRLARAALWLTPKAVEGYEPSDFGDLPEPEQKELQSAVERFRALADSVAPQSPPSDPQFREGLELLGRIASIVRRPILDDWKRAVEKLVSEAETWAGRHGWLCRREKKKITERLLDSYEMAQLLIQANGAMVVLDPVARFVPGALGVADLSLVPSYHFLTIPRTEDGWHIHIDTGRNGGSERREEWNECSFVEAVELLRQRA